MTPEELNRKISEARNEWHPLDLPLNDIQVRNHVRHPKDWTGSEEANAVLLEEMPRPILRSYMVGQIRYWECWSIDSTENWSNRHPDRKVVIAQAWLKFKGIE